MYLSTLLIDVGTNPDRVRPGRSWLRNIYRVHQRLCMAFPFPETKVNDPEFLKPYQPGAFRDTKQSDETVMAAQQESSIKKPVHVPRDGSHNFLFRIDPHPGGRVVIIVHSAMQPDWDYAFHNAQHLLAAPPSTSVSLQSSWDVGVTFRFRLVANPVYRARKDSKDQRGQPLDATWVGKRLPVPPTDAALRNWLDRRSEAGGFRLGDLSLIQPGYVYVDKPTKNSEGHRHRIVRYEGTIEVIDSQFFRQTLIAGIGPAKAFGCGLLSIAPAPGSIG